MLGALAVFEGWFCVCMSLWNAAKHFAKHLHLHFLIICSSCFHGMKWFYWKLQVSYLKELCFGLDCGITSHKSIPIFCAAFPIAAPSQLSVTAKALGGSPLCDRSFKDTNQGILLVQSLRWSGMTLLPRKVPSSSSRAEHWHAGQEAVKEPWWCSALPII